MTDAPIPPLSPPGSPAHLTAESNGARAVGDAERRNADDRLQRAVGAGAMSLADYEQRTARVWTAATEGALASATAGLPEPPPASGLGWGSSGKSPRALAVGWGLAAVGAVAAIAMVVAVNDEPASRRDRSAALVVVPADVLLFDVSRHADEVTIVVPDGVGVELDGLAAPGTIWCGDACAWPTGPWVQLQGAALEGVHVLSRSDDDRDEDLTTGMEP